MRVESNKPILSLAFQITHDKKDALQFNFFKSLKKISCTYMNDDYLVVTNERDPIITLPSNGFMTLSIFSNLSLKGKFVKTSPFRYKISNTQKQTCQSPSSLRFLTSKCSPEVN